MELEEIKVKWKTVKPVLYSREELDSIYHIKKEGVLASLNNVLTWDLLTSVIIAFMFIIVLQILDLKTSDFWSVCLAILTVQHIIFYQIQVYLIRRYRLFEDNITQSLSRVISRLNKLLWFYRVWPAILSLLLYTTYIIQFNPNWQLWIKLTTGVIIVLLTAELADLISAVMIKKYYRKLQALRSELLNYSSG